MVRNEVKKDLVAFMLPALVVFCAGLAMTAWDLVKRLVFWEWSAQSNSTATLSTAPT